MTKRPSAPRSPAPELPMDVADAAGGFGLLAGGLSTLLPYFLGLTVTLAILSAGVGLHRLPQGAPDARTATRNLLLHLGPALTGWIVFVGDPAPLGRFRGLVLSAAALPVWWASRRPRPFAGL